MKKIIIPILISTFFIAILPVKAINDTNSNDSLNLDSLSAILIDSESGKVLYQKNKCER